MIEKNTFWALVPARGGSKSIPQKNLAMLAGRPLLDYGVQAAKTSKAFSRIICSTDESKIATRAHALGIEVDWRSEELSTDEAAVVDVAREFLSRQKRIPEILALIQPTSPFLLPEHIDALLTRMTQNHDANSAQTICPTPHNFHPWNQRIVVGSRVRFMFAAERKKAYNKQRKPTVYSFGNLVAARSSALLDGMDFFAEPSEGLPVKWPYNLDVDGPDDLRLAETLLLSGMVDLDHMKTVKESRDQG
ncbi:MAG: acylneuraminate cytidylyltransferase family protein [Deltaproteobacteria bacterium]|nr:acylneuraminate cytidylyltransferase family protein [Deltaproteobacteria bacterium]MBW2152216.1 acylneuraminate cytidylyltransferase family protein [Deltaproteobacteria bacterium]